MTVSGDFASTVLNPWMVFSLILFGIWALLWMVRPRVRREMLWASLLTTPFGLTEPLFVPKYWSPPSLFNLAATTGFDIESLIFCFAIGGVGSVLYEAIVRVRHVKMTQKECRDPRHRFHRLVLASPFLAFIPLFVLTNTNPIYTASIAMLTGSLATLYCRPDLKRKMLVGAFMFLGLYFVFFVSFNLIYPDVVGQVWNLEAISGTLILGIPIEELLFAFTFGGLWSGYYEHINWYRLRER